MKIKIFFALIILASLDAQMLRAKIRLLTVYYNRPEFIEIQYKSLKKFLKEKDDFELILFNDANNEPVKNEIEQICHNLDIQCINFPQELHRTGKLLEELKPRGYDSSNTSIQHCQVIKYALDNFGYGHNDIVGILEGDVFMTREFSIREALNNYDIIGGERIGWQNLAHFWIGLVFIDFKKLPNKETLNFDLTWIGDAFLDSGGKTYHYLKNNPSVRAKKEKGVFLRNFSDYTDVQLKQLGFNANDISFVERMIGFLKNFPHYQECIPSEVEYFFGYSFIHFGCSRLHNQVSDKSVIFREYFNRVL